MKKLFHPMRTEIKNFYIYTMLKTKNQHNRYESLRFSSNNFNDTLSIKNVNHFNNTSLH